MAEFLQVHIPISKSENAILWNGLEQGYGIYDIPKTP